jgi:hypothetical protein
MRRIRRAAFGPALSAGLALVVLALAGSFAPAAAATLPATPANVAALLVSAACGDTITLDPTQAYPVGLTVTRTTDCADPNRLLIQANGATLDSWVFKSPKGITLDRAHLVNHYNGVGYTAALSFTGGMGPDGAPAWDCRGVTVTRARAEGPYLAEVGKPYNAGDGQGVSFLRCGNVEISGSYLTGFKVGGLFGMSSDVRFLDNECAMIRADCLNVGTGWGVLVKGNYCHFLKVTATEHPDCFQFYSRSYFPNSCTPMPPTSDVKVIHNRAVVYAQAIFFGSHEYPDICYGGSVPLKAPMSAALAATTAPLLRDGGFRVVDIEDNLLITGGGNAIGIGYTEGLTLKHNRVETLPSAFSYFNGGSLANINATNAGPGIVRCGNTVAAGAGKRGSADPDCLEDAPALPPDTRDAQIAGLTAQVTKLAADLTVAQASAAQAAGLSVQIATLTSRVDQLGTDAAAAQAAAAHAASERDAANAAAAQAAAEAAAAQAKADATAARFAALLTGLQDLATAAAAPAP